MIVDSLSASHRYLSLHPLFPRVFEWIARTDLAELPVGRYSLPELEDVTAIVAADAGKKPQAALLEVHRRFLDIQLPLMNGESMGWRSRGQCQRSRGPFDAERDIEFFDDPPAFWFPVDAGQFVVFYPDDAHAPLVGEGPKLKVVIKVPVHVYGDTLAG